MIVDHLRPSNRALPNADAALTHCQRVAVWSSELARVLNISVEERNVLETAALAHHLPPLSINSSNRKTLLRDLGIGETGMKDVVTARLQSAWLFITA